MPPMKTEEFRSWIKKRYGGMVRILTDGTDKASEEGHIYCREFLFYMVIGINIYYNTRINVKRKTKKQYLRNSRFMIELQNGEWYLKNHIEAKKYVDIFVNCVLEETLKNDNG